VLAFFCAEALLMQESDVKSGESYLACFADGG